MKILKIQATGLKLFGEMLEIDFFAKQRVNPDKNEMLTHVFSNIYINNVISMVGINASGKTTTLKVISFVIQMLKNEAINNIECKDILDGLETDEEACFTVYFVSGGEKLMKLSTVIKRETEKGTLETKLEKKYIITSEKLWTKSTSSVRAKNDLFDFSRTHLTNERSQDELFLLDDVSMILAFNKQQKETLSFIDSIDWTDFNVWRILGEFPISLVQFLDPSIEYIKFKDSNQHSKKFELNLKFYNKKQITIYSPLDISKYLSSGTIKGINIFMSAIYVLQRGGYLIVDELENHFNKEIVSTLIQFFMDEEINNTGAVLIFSTHYIELLDVFERNDNIYLVKNRNGIVLDNLSDLLKRNDVKKSEVFQSGYLENTAPTYDSYINFKRALIEPRKEGEGNNNG